MAELVEAILREMFLCNEIIHHHPMLQRRKIDTEMCGSILVQKGFDFELIL
jgi:hypothetical protein